MERISICDLEWYNGDHSMPNLKCMQLSSYYKQQGADITFITDKMQFSYNYDKMYICREKEETPVPDIVPIRVKDKVHLIGKGFRYYTNYDHLFSLLASVRPDYLLYSGIEGTFAEANFIQFFWDNTLITERQDYHKSNDNRKFTVVADRNFWQQKDSDIKYCLEVLSHETHIWFQHSISLNKLITNEELRELFFKLHFVQGTEFRWRNDFSSDNVQPIIAFLSQFNTVTKSNIGYVPIKAVVSGIEKEDVYRCLRVIDEFKQSKQQCRILINIDNCPSVLVNIGKWTEKQFKFSYIEFVTRLDVLKLGLTMSTILNNSRYWKSVHYDELLALICWEELREKGFLLRQWGEKKYNDIEIDYNYIRKNTNLLVRSKYE